MEKLLGGNPLAVVLKLVIVSIVTGIALHAMGFNPHDLLDAVPQLLRSIYNFGLRWVDSVVNWFLLGAVVVIPVPPDPGAAIEMKTYPQKIPRILTTIGCYNGKNLHRWCSASSAFVSSGRSSGGFKGGLKTGTSAGRASILGRWMPGLA
ncbi:MAG: DUF6460 domain-containing protein [Alphaproteobacteria bacterium]